MVGFLGVPVKIKHGIFASGNYNINRTWHDVGTKYVTIEMLELLIQ
jgi:hypothetical protein